MNTKNKFCQSCGMPMKQDPQGGGTNADGSVNAIYCSYCYQNGAFTFDGTVEEFQEFCRQKMIENGRSKFLAWLFTRNMKRLRRWKNLVVCFVLLFTFAAFTPRNTITGYIEGLTNDTVLVTLVPLDNFDDQEPVQDTIFAKNGQIEYVFPNDGAYGLEFSFPQFFIHNRPTGGLYAPHNSSLTVVVEPNSKISFKCSTNSAGLCDVSITGSTLNRDFAIIQNKLFEINKNAAKEVMALEQADIDNNKEAMDLGLTKHQERINARRQLYSDYIRTNLNNPLSALLLSQQPLDSIGLYYDKLGRNARKSIFRSKLDGQMSRHTEYSNVMKAQEEVVVGSKAPNFTLGDMDENPFTLSSLQGQGKYVIIDFWGSWCGPCIVGIPKMKSFYEKHKGEIEILGIACNETSIDRKSVV